MEQKNLTPMNKVSKKEDANQKGHMTQKEMS